MDSRAELVGTRGGQEGPRINVLVFWNLESRRMDDDISTRGRIDRSAVVDKLYLAL